MRRKGLRDFPVQTLFRDDALSLSAKADFTDARILYDECDRRHQEN